MSSPFCPHPVLLQRLYAGPWGVHIDPCAQQVFTQGSASWTAKDMMRLLADLSRWLQPQALTVLDRNDQCVADFLQDRSRRCRPPRHDCAPFRRLLAQRRAHGVIPRPMADVSPRAGDCIAHDLQHSLCHQRGVAPLTVPSSLDTVRRLLDHRCGPHPLGLEALGPQDLSHFL